MLYFQLLFFHWWYFVSYWHEGQCNKLLICLFHRRHFDMSQQEVRNRTESSLMLLVTPVLLWRVKMSAVDICSFANLALSTDSFLQFLIYGISSLSDLLPVSLNLLCLIAPSENFKDLSSTFTGSGFSSVHIPVHLHTQWGQMTGFEISISYTVPPPNTMKESVVLKALKSDIGKTQEQTWLLSIIRSLCQHFLLGLFIQLVQ